MRSSDALCAALAELALPAFQQEEHMVQYGIS